MFYENFERICRENETTPSAVGLALGLNKSTPSAWKRNRTIPKEPELKQMSELLGCTVADFFAPVGSFEEAVNNIKSKYELGEGAQITIYEPQDDTRDENVAEMLRVYGKCSTPRLRTQFMTMVYRFEDEAIVNQERE